MHDDHPPNKPADQLATAPRIRRLRSKTCFRAFATIDSSAHTEIKGVRAPTRGPGRGQLRAYGD